jgi:hypothetical protein
MTESLIAPQQIPQGAPDDVAPPTPAEQATSDAATLIYRGPDEEAAEAAETAAEAPQPEETPAAEAPTYEPFALPDGVEIDTAALEQAQSLFAEARLSQPQAQKLVDLYAGKLGELARRQVETQVALAEDRQKAWVAEVKNDPELGGRRFEAARAAALRALNRFGTPELRRTLDELWVGNNPQLFRFFVRVGQAVSEDRYAGAQSGASRLSAAETLYPGINDK